MASSHGRAVPGGERGSRALAFRRVGDVFVAAVVILALALAGVTVVAALVGRPLRRRFQAGALVLEVELIAQALVAGALALLGERPGEPGLFYPYVLLAPALLPMAALVTDGAKRTRWDGLAFGVALVAIAVVQLRLRAAW